MTIKGKGRTKSRPPARAPRRAPVPVPVPFVQRRWVQLTAAALVGAGLVLLAVWVTNGIRQNQADDQAAQDQAQQDQQASEQQTAFQGWQDVVENQIKTVGTIQEPTGPQVATELDAILAALAKGKAAPSGSAQTAAQLHDDLEKAATAIAAYKLVNKIRDIGFDRATATSFTDSQNGLSSGLKAAAAAAAVARSALDADPAVAKDLAKTGQDLLASARDELTNAWTAYSNARAGAGVAPPPPTSG
jgi:hypothetical protein